LSRTYAYYAIIGEHKVYYVTKIGILVPLRYLFLSRINDF
jgi:hypothetical protein